MSNKKNDPLMQQVDSQFRRTYSNTYAWADSVSAFMSLLGLRGFWSMAGQGTFNPMDYSGAVTTLNYTGNPVFNLQGLIPYIQFDGVGDYLTRADSAQLDILGTEAYFPAARRGLTMGGWFYFTNAAAAIETMMSKWGAAGQQSYCLIRTAAGLSQIGINGVGYAISTQVLSSGTWYFCVARYTPGAETAVWIDDTKWTSVAAIPAAIINSTAAFQIGALTGAGLLTGRATLCFLSAANQPDYVINSLFHISRALFGK